MAEQLPIAFIIGDNRKTPHSYKSPYIPGNSRLHTLVRGLYEWISESEGRLPLDSHASRCGYDRLDGFNQIVLGKLHSWCELCLCNKLCRTGSHIYYDQPARLELDHRIAAVEHLNFFELQFKPGCN